MTDAQNELALAGNEAYLMYAVGDAAPLRDKGQELVAKVSSVQTELSLNYPVRALLQRWKVQGAGGGSASVYQDLSCSLWAARIRRSLHAWTGGANPAAPFGRLAEIRGSPSYGRTVLATVWSPFTAATLSIVGELFLTLPASVLTLKASISSAGNGRSRSMGRREGFTHVLAQHSDDRRGIFAGHL
jgi:hypothetical protein